jgi:protease I
MQEFDALTVARLDAIERLMAGRTATCYRTVRQDLEAAGVNYLDREAVVDGSLVTSRRPGDIRAFMRAIFRLTGLSR